MTVITDQQVSSPPQQRRVPLESVLGSVRGRYFGAGYRSVTYSLTSTSSAHGDLAGIGQVTYPHSWSTNDSGQTRPPHLSSIDATLMTLALLESLTAPGAQEALMRSRITALRLVAGSTPFLTLDAVPIHIKVEETESDTKLRAVVGNIRVAMTLEATPSCIDLRSGLVTPIAASVYSALFRDIESTSWIRQDKRDLTRITGEHVLHLISTGRSSAPAIGLESLQWPAPTVVDYLVIMGQLTQALVYTAAGRRRSDSGPLWMRTIDMTLAGSALSLPVRFTTSVELLHDRTVQRGETTLHDCKVQSFASTGVSAMATLAYQES